MRRLAVLVLLLALATACGGGQRKPSFSAAPGWNLVASGGMGGAGEVTVANVPIAEGDRRGGPPYGTVKTLPRSGIEIWVQYYRSPGEGHFRSRALPLRLRDAARSAPFEGMFCAQAAATNCYRRGGSPSIRRLRAHIAGYDVDVFVTFGSDRPSAAQVAAAAAELARLKI